MHELDQQALGPTGRSGAQIQLCMTGWDLWDLLRFALILSAKQRASRFVGFLHAVLIYVWTPLTFALYWFGSLCATAHGWRTIDISYLLQMESVEKKCAFRKELAKVSSWGTFALERKLSLVWSAKVTLAWLMLYIFSVIGLEFKSS